MGSCILNRRNAGREYGVNDVGGGLSEAFRDQSPTANLLRALSLAPYK